MAKLRRRSRELTPAPNHCSHRFNETNNKNNHCLRPFLCVYVFIRYTKTLRAMDEFRKYVRHTRVEIRVQFCHCTVTKFIPLRFLSISYHCLPCHTVPIQVTHNNTLQMPRSDNQ